MGAVVEFANDVWDRSVERIRRADPLLMGAAIAYNGLFALVPLAIAFAAVLTFFDRTDEMLEELYAAISRNLPAELASFLTEVLQGSVAWVQDSRELILVLSVLVALWSGSRAVYAVQKALRTVEGIEDERGYLRTRGLGIVVTIGAGVGVFAAYFLILVGGRFWEAVREELGLVGGTTLQWLSASAIIVWGWLLLWAIYRWGPPRPLHRSGIVSAAVAVLIVVGSRIAFSVIPDFGTSSTLSFLGAVGVFLVWLYYIGIVVVAAPTVLTAFVDAIADRIHR
jgi:membrane protein